MRKSSLLVRLLLSFVSVIVLLVSFNFFSFRFYQDNIRAELIRNNEENMAFTVNRFEEHFSLLQKKLYALYFQERIMALPRSSAPSKYAAYFFIRQDILRFVDTPLLYIEELVLHFKDEPYVLGKKGTDIQQDFFSKGFASDTYPLTFWNQQFQENYNSKIFPAATFYEHSFISSANPLNKGEFIPFVIKHWQYADLFVIAYLDVKKMKQNYYRSTDDQFMIINDNQEIIYSDGDFELDTLTLESGDQVTYFLQNHNYYFLKRGEFSGFTYLNIIPASHIYEQTTRLNVTLISLLIVTLIISLIASLFFSVRFHTPVKRLITSLQGEGRKSLKLRTGIHEFSWISNKFDDILDTNARFEQDLQHKESQLSSYMYLNKVKNIYNGSQNLKITELTNAAFQFVVFEISYIMQEIERNGLKADRSTYFIRELINRSMLESYPNSLTIQVENQQILSIIHDPEHQTVKLETVLHDLLPILHQDLRYYFVTIAVSSIFAKNYDFNLAYKQTSALLQKRQLSIDTQIIGPDTSQSLQYHLLSAIEEEQFDNHMQAGNDQEALLLFERHLAMFMKKEATVKQYRDFAADIVQRVEKLMHNMRIPPQTIAAVKHDASEIIAFYTHQQYRDFFERFITESCEQIQQHRDKSDPIIDFVCEFVQKNYFHDLTLDIVAEQLRITGGYLSSYFKEKSGENFIDYINRVRISHAQNMLIQTDLRVNEIALRAGYQNIHSFNRMFKKFSGTSPREYRKQAASEHCPALSPQTYTEANYKY